VVVDQNLLCCANRVLHCVQLLHYLETRTVVFDHVDHVSEMALQALQALDNLRVSSMRFLSHILSQRTGLDIAGLKLIVKWRG